MNREDTFRWTKSILIALIVFSLFSFYLFERRGYYNLYIINKVFGSTAAVIAGIALLIGPLSQKFTVFAKVISIRRNLGLLAFALALIHVVLSVAFLPNKFPVSWFIKEWVPITFGILAILVWTYITYISRNSKIKQLGAGEWKKRLSISGQVAFILIFLHLTLMKYQGWIKWFNGQLKQTPDSNFPPASLFVLFFMVGVIFYRLDLLKLFNSLLNRWMGRKEIK